MRSVPDFPKKRPLELGDKPLFDRLFKKYPPTISEFTFTNLFAWRHSYHFCVSWTEGCYLVVSERPDKFFAYEPIGGIGKKTKAVLKCFALEPKLRFERMSEAAADLFRKEGHLCLEEQREHFDYVYRASDLAELKGRRFDAKRNFIRRFRERYPEFVYKKLTADNVGLCFAFEEEWCRAKDCFSVALLRDERGAMREMLEHFETLALTGGLIEVGGRVEAVTFGERLNPETFVIHMEKANGKLPGLYQAINQMLAAAAAGSFAYINREQDLGIPGLRLAKESYHPCTMVKKYALRLKEGS